MSNVTKSQEQEISAMDEKSTKSIATDERCSSTEIDQVCEVGCGKHDHDQQGSGFERSSSPGQMDSAVLQEEDRLKSARAEMGQVREENEKLKSLLSQVVKDYRSLQRQYFDVFRQEAANKTKSTNRSPSDNQEKVKEGEGKEEGEEEAELALTLGRTSSMSLNNNNNNLMKDGNKNDGQTLEKELSLGQECRYEKVESMGKQVMKNDVTNKPVSSDESFEEAKEEEPTAIWPPSKVLKTMKGNDDDVVLQQPQLKKARVSIRVRCDTPTINDGCQWRKYGQKIAKGNPCPRAYYRCTVSPSCPVRKQVQRCYEDTSILITTYEGNHNHPLPISATAMASTTSAAASMLQSRSTTSHAGSGLSATASTSISSSPNLYGMDFNMSTQNAKHHPFFPNTTISTCNSHPTVTLDLTTPAKSSHFNSMISSNFLPKYSSPCLSFSSSTSSSSLPSNWNYTMQPIDRNHPYQSCAPMNATYAIPNSQQPSLTDTLAAAAKVLASNPSFQTALAAALTTFVGNGTTGSIDNLVQGGNSTLAMNWHGGGPSSENSHPLTSQGNGVACAANYLSKTMSLSSQQQGSLINLFPPMLSLSTSSKSASTSSPSNNKDHDKIFANSDV